MIAMKLYPLSESGQPEVVEQANGGWVDIFCANVEERVNMFLLLQNYFSIAPVCTSIQFWHKQEECCMKAQSTRKDIERFEEPSGLLTA